MDIVFCHKRLRNGVMPELIRQWVVITKLRFLQKPTTPQQRILWWWFIRSELLLLHAFFVFVLPSKVRSHTLCWPIFCGSKISWSLLLILTEPRLTAIAVVLSNIQQALSCTPKTRAALYRAALVLLLFSSFHKENIIKKRDVQRKKKKINFLFQVWCCAHLNVRNLCSPWKFLTCWMFADALLLPVVLGR